MRPNSIQTVIATAGIVALSVSASPTLAQSSPGLVPPSEGSAWMWGQSLDRVMGQLRVRSDFGNYSPQQRCAMAVVTSEGEVQAFAVAEEAVAVEDGMSAARACAPLLDGTAREIMAGGDVFMEGEYLTPMGLTMTPELFYEGGTELDGYMLADEISAWGTMGAKPEGEVIPAPRLPDPNAVWQAFLIFFMPTAYEFEDAWASGTWQARPLVIDMHPDRMGG